MTRAARHYRDVASLYQNPRDDDLVVYEVYTHDEGPARQGNLLWGRTVMKSVDSNGETWAERMCEGSLHYIDGRLAHRCVSTSATDGELDDGNKIPAIGFGVFMIPTDGPTYDATLAALEAGYRHIDTAAAHMNEQDVGRAVRDLLDLWAWSSSAGARWVMATPSCWATRPSPVPPKKGQGCRPRRHALTGTVALTARAYGAEGTFPLAEHQMMHRVDVYEIGDGRRD